MTSATGAQKLKIVAFGSVNGEIGQLTQKMASVHTSKAGPFDLFLISGNLFGSDPAQNEGLADSLLKNEFKFPAPTYFIAGASPLPASLAQKVSQGGDVCENLTFLGKAGVLETACGAKLAYLSGTEFPAADGGETEQFTEQEAHPLLEETAAEDVDILLTYDWPDMVHGLSAKWKLQLDAQVPKSSKIVSRIAAKLQPKYHFAAPSAGLFFEREPYRTPCAQDEGQADQTRYTVSRFISLGSLESKQRWAYAMNLAQGTLAVQESELPPKTTPTPYRIQTKPALAEQAPGKAAVPQPIAEIFHQPLAPERRPEKRPYQDGPNHEMDRPQKMPLGYICNICKTKGHYIANCPEKTNKKVLKPQDCWFCLANPKVTKHLIVSLGNAVYLSIAKGSLVDPFGPSCLVPGGGNLILVSILHVTSFLTGAPGTCAALTDEIVASKDALTAMFNKFGAAPVFFEAYRPGGQHAHLQVAPVPLALVSQLEDAFKAAGTEVGFDLSRDTRADPNTTYFQVQLPDGVVLTSLIPRSTRFNLAFGREVLGKLMGTPERIDWRQCEFSFEQEQTMRNSFFDAFKPFSPFSE